MKVNKKLHKGLAWVLTLCMVLTILPVTAFAADCGGIAVEGGELDTDYSYNSGSKVLTILTDTPLTLSGTGTSVQVLVAGTTEANLTLSGLYIDNTAEGCGAPIQLMDTAKLNLILAEGSTNTLDTHYANGSIFCARADAIHVPQDTTLDIDGTGTLTAYSGRYHAAIGNDAGATGDITITGGTVNALAYGTENYPGGVGIGGITQSDSASGGGSITISGGTVTAYGDMAGIGYYDSSYNTYSPSDVKTNYAITISSGTVNAYGIPYSDDVDPEDAQDTYLSSVGIGGHAIGVPGTRNIVISGGTVKAYGSNVGIGGYFDESNDDGSTDALSIRLTGGQITAKSFATYDSIGIGGKMSAQDHRTIEISGTAVVNALGRYYKSSIGGGDNSQGTITIKGSAVVFSASTIGSTGYDSDTNTGFSGGTIQILEGASVNGNSYERVEHIGGSSLEYGTGGAGGSITINTTGVVNAATIGGGSGDNGGSGGNITLQNGTVLSDHIGGGNGLNSDGTGTGGDGGTITISGGKIGEHGGGSQAPTGSTNQKVGYGENTYYYSSAGIGGGGGTFQGGSGGTITITGGEVYASAGVTVYNSSTGEATSTGTGVGGAGIGGGNGADGGTINISGGNVEVSYVSIYPYEALSATAAPALIGGGSAGGAGNITISGGYVKAAVSSENFPVYGDDATIIGQGKGATNAGGWVKVTGGTLSIPINTYQTTVARPVPWPTSSDGSTKVYPATLDFYGAQDIPEGLSFYENSEMVSLVITKKSDNAVYSYGIKDISPTSYLWLPIAEDVTQWEEEAHELFDVRVSVKKDNTVYSFEGTIRFFTNENFVGGITSSTTLAYKGEVIETLQLSSNWGNQTKIYNGSDQKPTFTVKNINGETLTEGEDYTLKIEYAPNGTGVRAETTQMKNSGHYYVTATGVNGTAYEDMTATLDELWINPKEITGIFSGSLYTKQYDGTTDVYDSNGDVVDSIALTVNSADLCSGDVLTGINAANPRYASSSIGTDIDIIANSTSYTYTQNGEPSSIYNYTIEQPTNLKGDITVKVIGETSLDTSAVTVTKVYDGTTNCLMVNVSGSVTLNDLIGTEIATVNITGVSAFDSKDVGNTHTVTLTIGGLAGANAANYTLAGGASSVEIATASITPADYAYNLTEAQQAQEFTQGGGLSQISLPETATGVNGEMVSGTVTLWHDAPCTANQANDASVNALTAGEHNLYIKFVPDESETNYTHKVTTGKVVVLTVVEGEPQGLSFETPDVVTKTYGDIAFTNAASNSSVGGGAITYSSDNTAVAQVNENTGEVTIIGAGEATLTATAAKVDGLFRRTTISYTLTISKKPITVTAMDKTKTFGTANPTLTFSVPDGALVGNDDPEDLSVTLFCAATTTSPAGTPVDITGASTSANYSVTVAKGTLTIAKADAPTVSDIQKNLLFSEDHNGVAVNITGLPSDKGATSFAVGIVTGDALIINGDVSLTATGIQFSTHSGAENQIVIIPVTVTMQNYEAVSLNVVITLVNKIPVIITGVTVTSKTYDGMEAVYTGAPTNEQGYDGTYEYVWSGGFAPKNTGSYTLTVKIPENDADYMGEVEIPFIIEKKALTVKPQNISIYNGETLPSSFTLEYVGLVSGDTITLAGAPAFELKNGTETLTGSSINGTYTIEWINKDDVAVDHANYTVAKANGTLTISNRPSGGSSDTGGAAPIPQPTAPAVSTGNGTSTATFDAQVRSSGTTATASVSSNHMKTAIEAAKKAANENKTAPAVEIIAKTPANATEVEFAIPKTALTDFAGSDAASLSMVSDIGELGLSAKTVASIVKQAGGSDIVMSLAKVDVKKELNEQQQAAVGGAPVYDISINSDGKKITAFDGGTITVSLPYTLKDGEDPSGIVVWYLDEKGNIQKVQSSYDAAIKTVTFTTNHLSLYAVGYDESLLWNNPFSDVSEGSWYYAAVRFVHQQGMMGGTSQTTFSPDMTMTRGMLVTILYRMEGTPAVVKASFTDVSAGAWYADAVSWAVINGVAGGYGGGRFGPEDSITREQMAVILMNYAKLKGYNTTYNDDGLSAFSDAAVVSSWASGAMKWAVSQGLITGTGKNGSILDPNGSAIRCQAAAILTRFCEMLKK